MSRLILIQTDNSHPLLRQCMEKHYSKPLGFVGRNICYAIYFGRDYFGHIIGGSATKNLKQRDDFFGLFPDLNSIINNIFFHIEPIDRYPIRNFAPQVLKLWRKRINEDWEKNYGNKIIGFESLVEYPRIGQCYYRDKWHYVGDTHGFTCKRTAGKGTDSWSGKRVWDTENLRPKRIFVRDN